MIAVPKPQVPPLGWTSDAWCREGQCECGHRRLLLEVGDLRLHRLDLAANARELALDLQHLGDLGRLVEESTQADLLGLEVLQAGLQVDVLLRDIVLGRALRQHLAELGRLGLDGRELLGGDA